MSRYSCRRPSAGQTSKMTPIIRDSSPWFPRSADSFHRIVISAGSRRVCRYALCNGSRARLYRVAWHLDDRVAQVEIDLASSSRTIEEIEGHPSLAVGDIDVTLGR